MHATKFSLKMEKIWLFSFPEGVIILTNKSMTFINCILKKKETVMKLRQKR